ncbi:VOC family protein [Herbiconiux sp. KACC 21604]|uniref:VOC family protein n=1 Tax=unclassified Herbiconiux TaxID=2618217 RepID=UPI001492883A|nr:VOC family protein [Herbiconiux sp. SALV-R1]QJU52712.1 VOC family protein [Herbiconiux sp. SALV-R1]WPO87612.1 VOC family protein [Herbiconiux sp. KACC 21604]
MTPPSPAVLPRPLQSLEVKQIGLLVPDLKAALAQYSLLLGRDDWSIFTYGPGSVDHLTYRGEPSSYRMRLAFVGAGPQIELVESLDGPNIYTEWIERHGYGMHHFGFYVDSIADTTVAMQAEGFEPIQTGSATGQDGDGGYAYFDTENLLGAITELIEVPSRRRPTERV